MNAAFLLMTSAWMAGADAAPAAAPAPVVVAAAGCSNCAAPAECDSCGRASLFDRLRAKFKSVGGHKHKGCDTCDTCAAPAPAPAPCAVPAPCDACADPCGGHKAGFFDRLKGRLGGHKHKGCDTCDTGCATGGCATPGAPAVAPAAPADAPKEMPKPATPAKSATPKTTSITLPIPVAPVTPVSGGQLSGTTNPF